MSAVPPEADTLSGETRTREQARATYDRISRWYDLVEGMWEQKARSFGLSKLPVHEGETVLEIGFGTGHSLVALARGVGMTGRVFGVDLSPGMVGVTRSRLRARGLSDRVPLVCADATSLPYAPCSFDAVFMSFVLELFDTPEIPVVLEQCRMALRDGGHVCVVALSRCGGLSWMGRLYEWGHLRFPWLLDCRLIHVRAALAGAGFAIADASLISLFGLPVEVVLARKPAG